MNRPLVKTNTQSPEFPRHDASWALYQLSHINDSQQVKFIGRTHFLCVRRRGSGDYEVFWKPKPNFFERVARGIARALLSLIGKKDAVQSVEERDIEDLKDLRCVFSDIAKTGDHGEAEQRRLKRSADALKQLYDLHRGSRDTVAAAIRHDILESVAEFTRVELDEEGELKEVGLNRWLDTASKVSRVAADPIQALTGRFADSSVPVLATLKEAEMQEVLSAYDALVDEIQGVPTAEQLQKDPVLSKFLEKEEVFGKGITERLYRHRRLTPPRAKKFFRNIINWFVTQRMFRMMSREFSGPCAKTSAKIVGWMTGNRIALGQAYKGEMYAYSEMFTTRLREEESLVSAFTRMPRPEAFEMLLRDAKLARQRVREVVGETGAVVTSNSYCRVRVHNMPRGTVDRRIRITGKLLNDSEENQKLAERERSYEQRFGFSIKNMFGYESKATTKFGGPRGIPRFSLATSGASAEKVDRYAEEVYLAALTNAVNREDATMVIQRLAPADMHHYVEPVGGRVLTIGQACQKLAQLVDASKNPEELAQLDELIRHFESQPETDRSKCFVQLTGTRDSVSTVATRHSSPLSQNDRKIMMVEHADGSIAIHTFIGAAGVNNVSVNVEEGHYELGADVGDMGAGDDVHGRRNGLRGIQANRQSLIRARAGRVHAGQPVGGFPPGGSTVVSLYFKKDFVMTDAVSQMSRKVLYRQKRGDLHHVVEFRAELGQQLGWPVNYVAYNQLSQLLLDSGSSFEELLKQQVNPVALTRQLLIRIKDQVKHNTAGLPSEKIRNQLIELGRCLHGSNQLTSELQNLYDKLLDVVKFQKQNSSAMSN